MLFSISFSYSGDYRLNLPPLNALKAFEAAARSGSYVAAARELNVTPAAISMQVRHLEEFLGRTLFIRLNNRIVLTDAGQIIYAGSTPALEDIATLTERVKSGSTRNKLVVSVVASLAECWFVPKFAKFATSFPEVLIDLRVEEDPVDFAAQEIDLRLCYGSHPYPDLKTIPLFRDHLVPIFAPDFLRQPINELPDPFFIHTSWGPNFASLPSWNEWCGLYAVDRKIDMIKGHRVGMSRLAIDFARHGLGVALGQWHLALADLQAGKLIADEGSLVPLAHDYLAVYPHVKTRKHGLKTLVDWLLNEVANDLKTQTPHR